MCNARVTAAQRLPLWTHTLVSKSVRSIYFQLIITMITMLQTLDFLEMAWQLARSSWFRFPMRSEKDLEDHPMLLSVVVNHFVVKITIYPGAPSITWTTAWTVHDGSMYGDSKAHTLWTRKMPCMMHALPVSATMCQSFQNTSMTNVLPARNACV